jgi:hypothetical protein
VKLVELVAEAGDARVTPRFVRYLIAENIIPPPQGGRANADYGAAHLAGIRRYLALRDHGYTAAAAKELATAPIEIAPGITLAVDPSKLEKTLDPRAIGDEVARALAHFLAPETDHADRRHRTR